MHKLEKRTKIGVVWSTVSSGLTQISNFIMGIFLARLLNPEHFGVFAAIIIFTEVASSIISSGMVMALVQRRGIKDEHYNSVFLIQLMLAILLFSVCYLISPFIGSFFNNSIVGKVLRVYSSYFLILPLVSIPVAKLRREIDFRSLGIIDFTHHLISGIASIIMAFLGFGVWSIVYGKLLGWIVKYFLLTYRTRWIPNLKFRWKSAEEIFMFGIKASLMNVINDFARNLDYTIIGRMLGPFQLGLYQRAYNLMILPQTRIVDRIEIVLFSAFSETQSNNELFAETYFKSICYISIICFPILTGLFWVADSFVYNVYGPKWLGSVLPLKVMCFAGMIFSIEQISISAIVSHGYIGFEMKRQIFYVIILGTLVYYGSFLGIFGVALAVLTAAIIFLIVVQNFLKNTLNIGIREFVNVLKPAVFGCVLMSLILFLFQFLVKNYIEISSLPMLLSSILFGSLSYIIFLVLIKDKINNPILKSVFLDIKINLLKWFRGKSKNNPMN